jgi:hypothetical protein
MRKTLLGLIFLISCAGTSPTSSTWNGTAGGQLLTGAALRDGATVTGNYTIDVTIPASYDTRIVTNQYIIDHTDAGGAPGQSNSQCPTKDAFASQF